MSELDDIRKRRDEIEVQGDEVINTDAGVVWGRTFDLAVDAIDLAAEQEARIAELIETCNIETRHKSAFMQRSAEQEDTITEAVRLLRSVRTIGRMDDWAEYAAKVFAFLARQEAKR